MSRVEGQGAIDVLLSQREAPLLTVELRAERQQVQRVGCLLQGLVEVR